MNYYVKFLNPEVKKEVESDRLLYVAWSLTHGEYDEERDPLHNLDYVKSQQILESRNLQNLKNKIASLHEEFFRKNCGALK